MSRKRQPGDAGIEIHQKVEDFLYHQQQGKEDDGAAATTEEDGNSMRANESVLRERKIVRARRPSVMPSSSSSDKPIVNPFATLSFAAPSVSKSSSTPAAVLPSVGGAYTTPSMPSSNGSASHSNGSSSKLGAKAAMNMAFLAHVQKLIQENPTVSLVDAIEEYLAYNREIAQEDAGPSTVAPLSSHSSVAPTTTTTTSLFPPAPPTTTTSTSDNKPIFSAPPTSLFGSAPTSSLFGGSIGSGSLFSGGGGGGIFGNINPGAGLFSGVKPSAAATGNKDDVDGGGEDGEDGGGPDEPEEATVAVVKAKNEEEDELAQVDPGRVTMYRTDGKEWVGKGKGRVQVLRDKKTSKCRIVVNADTTGKVMFNAPLNASIRSTLKRASKKSVTMMLRSFSPSPENVMQLVPDNDGKPAMYCVTVKDERDCNTLFKALEQAVGN